MFLEIFPDVFLDVNNLTSSKFRFDPFKVSHHDTNMSSKMISSKYICSHRILVNISACISRGRLWSDLSSLLYMLICNHHFFKLTRDGNAMPSYSLTENRTLTLNNDFFFYLSYLLLQFLFTNSLKPQWEQSSSIVNSLTHTLTRCSDWCIH